MEGLNSLHLAALKGFGNIVQTLLNIYDSASYIANSNNEQKVLSTLYGPLAFVNSASKELKVDVDIKARVNDQANYVTGVITRVNNDMYDIKTLDGKTYTGLTSDLIRVDGESNNSLHLAVSKNRIDVVDVLLNRMSAVNYMSELRSVADVNARDSNGFTALHIAVSKGLTSVIPKLCTGKLDINAKAEDSGDSVLHLACAKGSEEILTLLLDKLIDSTDRLSYQATKGIFKDQFGDRRWVLISPNGVEIICQSEIPRASEDAGESLAKELKIRNNTGFAHKTL